jgi:hypothetical protein
MRQAMIEYKKAAAMHPSCNRAFVRPRRAKANKKAGILRFLLRKRVASAR